MSFHLRPRLVGALLALLALFALTALAGQVSAQTPVPAAPSPEELLLGLLNYRLQPTDLPSGFQITSQEANTPASRAFGLAQNLSDLQPGLQQVQNAGLLTGFTQVIGPNGVTPVRIFVFEAELYTTAARASAALGNSLDLPSGDGIESDNPPVPLKLGDETSAIHVTVTQPDSDNLAIEALLWRRGRLVFSTLMEVIDGTESIDQVVLLAAIADRRAASLAPPAVSTTAALPAAGSEAARLDAAGALYMRLPSAAQNPLGFRSVARSVITNADLVLRASDPRAAYNQFANSWKRVVEVERTYTTLQGATGDVIHIRYALSADAAGATANVLDPQHEPGSTVATFAVSSALGDISRLYHETYTGDDGVPREAWRVIWSHDRVVLIAYTTGPAGDFTADDALGLASGVDSRYSRSDPPGVLTEPLSPAPVPVPITRTGPHPLTPLLPERGACNRSGCS